MKSQICIENENGLSYYQKRICKDRNSRYHRDILNSRRVTHSKYWIRTWLFDNIFHFLITYLRITDFSYELNMCIDAKPYCSIDKTDYNKTDFYSFHPSLFTLSIFMEIRTIIIRYRDCTFWMWICSKAVSEEIQTYQDLRIKLHWNKNDTYHASSRNLREINLIRVRIRWCGKGWHIG